MTKRKTRASVCIIGCRRDVINA